MELHSDYEVQCEKYLLGELSEGDSQQLEEAYFADDSLFERFVAVKEDLLDAYARGLLTGNKRKHFEKQFLGSKPRREEIEDARQLIRVSTALPHDPASQRATPPTVDDRHSLWNWLAGRSVLIPVSGLATLLIIAFGSWMLLRDRQNRIQKDNGQANQNVVSNPSERNAPGERTATVQATPQVSPAERGNVKQTSGRDNGRPIGPSPTSGLNLGGERGRSRGVRSTEPEQVASQSSAEETVALVIEPRSSRSISAAPTPTPTNTPNSKYVLDGADQIPEVPRLLLNANVKSVQLTLVYHYEVEGSVDVTISDMEGREIASVHDLEIQSGETKSGVSLRFPAERLKRKDHIVRLSTRTKEGTSETIAEYYFTVIRKGPTRTGPRKQ